MASGRVGKEVRRSPSCGRRGGELGRLGIRDGRAASRPRRISTVLAGSESRRQRGCCDFLNEAGDEGEGVGREALRVGVGGRAERQTTQARRRRRLARPVPSTSSSSCHRPLPSAAAAQPPSRPRALSVTAVRSTRTMMAPPSHQQQHNQPAASSSSSTSLVRHYEHYFPLAEVEHLTGVARGKQSIHAAKSRHLSACAFAEFVGARLGLCVAHLAVGPALVRRSSS